MKPGVGDFADVVTHSDARVSQVVSAYLAELSRGTSVLVRPVHSYDGMDGVVESLRSVASERLYVTDLHSVRLTVPGRPGGHHLVAFHSSGSTGSPKCVVYQRSTVIAHAHAIADALALAPAADTGVRCLALPPMRYAYGLSIVHSHALRAVPVRFVEASWGLPELSRALTADPGPFDLYVLPQHVPSLLASDLPGRRLRRLIVAGGRLARGSVHALAAAFPGLTLVSMYGQAELGPRLALWQGPVSEFVAGELGTPLAGVELRLGDDDVIAVRTPFAHWARLAPPYRDLTPGPAPDHLVPTGDLASREAGARLVHRGRADHEANVAGTRVDLAQLTRIVEDRFEPLATRVSVVPGRLSERVRLEIVPRARGLTATQVRQCLAQEFGGLAALFTIMLVSETAKGESGK